MTEPKRRAPKKGYDNRKKQEYRIRVWEYLSNKCIHLLDNENAKVLLLPSKEGIEIDVAISFGIKPHQIIAVDENPALIAVSAWRKKYPTVNFFGCKVSEVGERIRKRGWYLVGANLDFCNNFSQELIDEINGFFDITPIDKSFSFCVTMGKGRESKALYLILKHIKTPDVFANDRMGALYEMIELDKKINSWMTLKDVMSIDFEKSYFDTYPMIYAAFSFNEYVFMSDDMINIKRQRVLKRRRARLNQITISRDIYGKRALDNAKEGFKNHPEWYRQEYAIRRGYTRRDICFNDRQRKRSELNCIVSDEIKDLQDIMYERISKFCDDMNIINKENFVLTYGRQLADSVIEQKDLDKKIRMVYEQYENRAS